MHWMIFIGVAVALGVGLCLAIWKFSPLVLGKPKGFADWIGVISLIPAMILIASLIDGYASRNLVQCLDECRCSETIFCQLIKAFLNNGCLIPILCGIMSLLFETVNEKWKLNKHKLYSSLVAKSCFSIYVVLLSVAVLVLGFGTGDGPLSVESEWVLNRIVMWILLVVGTWIGFGIGVDRQKPGYSKKTIREFTRPIELSVIVSSLIILLSLVSKIRYLVRNVVANYYTELFVASLAFMLAFLTSMIVIVKIINPVKSEEKRLRKAIKRYEAKGEGKGYFRRIRYVICDGKLLTDRNVKCYDNRDKAECDHIFHTNDKYTNFDNALNRLNEISFDQERMIRRFYVTKKKRPKKH